MNETEKVNAEDVKDNSDGSSKAYEEWAKTLSASQRKSCIDHCLDEYEATFEVVKTHRKIDAEHLKEAKAWCEKQKKLLRILGYHKRMPPLVKKSETNGELIFK